MLEPLYMRAGYEDDDVFWGLVFLFSAQFAALSDAIAAAERAHAAMITATEQAQADAIKTVGDAAKRVRRETSGEWRFPMFVGAAFGLLLGGLLAVFEVERRAGGGQSPIDVVRAHSPMLAERLFDVPAVGLSLADAKWCVSEASRHARSLEADDLAWCGGSAGEQARELGGVRVFWGLSDIGTRAFQQLRSMAELDFLASPWGRLALTAWLHSDDRVVAALEALARCEDERLASVTDEADGTRRCRFSVPGEANLWVVLPESHVR